MAVPSSLGDVKYSVPNLHFRAKYIDTQIKFNFFNIMSSVEKLQRNNSKCMFLLTQVSLINFKQLFFNLFIFVNLLVLKSVSIAVFD